MPLSILSWKNIKVEGIRELSARLGVLPKFMSLNKLCSLIVLSMKLQFLTVFIKYLYMLNMVCLVWGIVNPVRKCSLMVMDA